MARTPVGHDTELNLLRQLDRHPAAGLDGFAQQPVARRLFGALVPRRCRDGPLRRRGNPRPSLSRPGPCPSAPRSARHNVRRSLLPPPRCRQRRLSRPTAAVAAPRAKPATRHTGSSAVGRTRRSFTSRSKALRWRCSCSAMCRMVSTLAARPCGASAPRAGLHRCAPRHIRRHDPPGSWTRCPVARTGRGGLLLYASCLRLSRKDAGAGDGQEKMRIVGRQRQAEQAPGHDIAAYFRRRCARAHAHRHARRAGAGSRQRCPIACPSDRRRSGRTRRPVAIVTMASACACLFQNETSEQAR